MGGVEVSGKALGPYTLVSPLSRRDCLYYRAVIRVLRKSSSQIIDELCAPLFIDDGTGELMICPKGAEMQLTGSEGYGGEYLTHVLSLHRLSQDNLEPLSKYSILPTH